jgi:hypothetical protein
VEFIISSNIGQGSNLLHDCSSAQAKLIKT